MNSRYRQLLAGCKGVQVKLRPLTEEVIKMWNQPKTTTKCMPQSQIQRIISNLSPDITVTLIPVKSESVNRQQAATTKKRPLPIQVDYRDQENLVNSSNSFGSNASENHKFKKNRELLQLSKDECKELKRNGLEEITGTSQRLTRCRSKSIVRTIDRA